MSYTMDGTRYFTSVDEELEDMEACGFLTDQYPLVDTVHFVETAGNGTHSTDEYDVNQMEFLDPGTGCIEDTLVTLRERCWEDQPYVMGAVSDGLWVDYEARHPTVWMYYFFE